MMLFLTRTGLECARVVGPELGLPLGWSAGSGAALLCKDKKEERSARASPVAAPMPKLVPHWEKDRLLRGRMFLRTFHRWGDLVFIAYVFPIGWW